MDKRTDGQTTAGQTEGDGHRYKTQSMDRWTNKWTEGQTDKLTDRYGWTNEQTDGQTDKETDGQMNRETDKWTDGVDREIDRPGELSGHLARPPVMGACVLRTYVRLQRKLLRSNTPSN